MDASPSRASSAVSAADKFQTLCCPPCCHAFNSDGTTNALCWQELNQRSAPADDGSGKRTALCSPRMRDGQLVLRGFSPGTFS